MRWAMCLRARYHQKPSNLVGKRVSNLHRQTDVHCEMLLNVRPVIGNHCVHVYKCKLATPRNVLNDRLRGEDRRISTRFADLRGPAAGRRNFWREGRTNRSFWLTV
jgi:hypothetical protein